MGIDKRQEAYIKLLEQADKQGYITFDNIMDCADDFFLPIQDFDWLSSSITTRGILVYDKAPTNREDLNQEEDDYAQIDYEMIYNRIIELDEVLKPFVSEVKNIKPPQWKEFTQLKYQVLEGNKYARERMIEMHLRLALKIALNRTEAYDMEIQDAIGEACIGLVTAVDKYDPDINGAFGSYASMWILQSLSRKQPTRRSLMYYPVHKKEIYFSAYPFLKSNGFIVDQGIEEYEKAKKILIRKLSFTDEQAEDILLAAIPFESYEEKYSIFLENINVFEEYENDSLICPRELISGVNIDQQITDIMLKKQFVEILETLTERERKVIELRYGWVDGEEKTLEEVGSIFNLTRERVRQIEKKAIEKLRHPSRSRKLQDYIDFMWENSEKKTIAKKC